MRSEGWQDRVIAEALSWKGTPYVPKARVKGVGVDCGGLLYQSYNPEFGPFAAYPTDYSADWAAHGGQGERYLDFIMPYVQQCPRPIVGGFSLFHVGHRYSHAAIYLPDDKYIHAWGRLREGYVAITPGRVMRAMAKTQEFPTKHFEPI